MEPQPTISPELFFFDSSRLSCQREHKSKIDCEQGSGKGQRGLKYGLSYIFFLSPSRKFYNPFGYPWPCGRPAVLETSPGSVSSRDHYSNDVSAILDFASSVISYNLG